MELRQKEGDDAFHPSIEYFLGNFILIMVIILRTDCKISLSL